MTAATMTAATTADAAAPAPRRRASGVKQAFVLLVFVALCLAVEGLIAWITQPAIEPWYRNLAKPAWTPPDLAFPVVWTVLYLLMAFAGWQAWRASAPGTFGWPLACFLVQLALNPGWSYLFFARGEILVALVELLALVLAVLATLIAFWRISRLAGVLLLPYLAWALFATALNVEIVRLNLFAGAA
jgi:tryptophan-rich sensory protein